MGATFKNAVWYGSRCLSVPRKTAAICAMVPALLLGTSAIVQTAPAGEREIAFDFLCSVVERTRPDN